MTDPEQRALLGLTLMGAFADGSKSDIERDRIRQIVEGFHNPSLNALELYRDVLLKRVTIRQLAQQLPTPEKRLLAYEMALGVCDADDRLNDAEKTFLAELQRELGIAENTAAPLREQADQLAAAALPPVLSSPSSPAARGTPSDLDSTILNHAILAGALELLPSSLVTMAILPLQMRLVYRVGQQYGHQLDRGHIGEFLATAGIGATSQVLEGYATKLLKGLLGTVAGAIGRGAAGTLTGSAVAFATTWAIGELAKRYYAGGRSLNGMQLQQDFQSLVAQARTLQQQYLPQIQQRSQNLNLSDIVRLAGR
jgi:uncharacterized protein (DUF697 family)